MIKTIKRLLTTMSIGSLLALPVLVPVAAHAADIQNGLCNGINLEADPGNDCNPQTNGQAAVDTVNNTLTLVINIFSFIVGVVSVIMIIVGGLKYITSGGDSANVQGAKNTIIYAIVGLVVVALAQVIVRFVLARTTAV